MKASKEVGEGSKKQLSCGMLMFALHTVNLRPQMFSQTPNTVHHGPARESQAYQKKNPILHLTKLSIHTVDYMRGRAS